MIINSVTKQFKNIEGAVTLKILDWIYYGQVLVLQNSSKSESQTSLMHGLGVLKYPSKVFYFNIISYLGTEKQLKSENQTNFSSLFLRNFS